MQLFQRITRYSLRRFHRRHRRHDGRINNTAGAGEEKFFRIAGINSLKHHEADAHLSHSSCFVCREILCAFNLGISIAAQ